MKYKLCPSCELNYIPENEEICPLCRKKAENDDLVQTNLKKSALVDFSHLTCGHVYGTNSRIIYQKFCKTLGWDKSQISNFGFRRPLYAKNADTKRENDIWFICYPCYNINDNHIANLILNDGDDIIEIVSDNLGLSNNANRITFVKTKTGYAFLGVYKLIKNGTKRIYKRISNIYPLPNNHSK